MNAKIPTYDDWLKANGKGFSLFDYLYGEITQYGAPADIVWAVAKLTWPEFVMVDGRVFLKECFTEEKYASLRNEGRAPKEMEYWMNMVNVGGLFAEGDGTKLAAVAATFSAAWPAKAKQDCPSLEFDCEVIEDDGDTFITLHRK